MRLQSEETSETIEIASQNFLYLHHILIMSIYVNDGMVKCIACFSSAQLSHTFKQFAPNLGAKPLFT
jgi:hypothetical protein